MRSKDFAVDLDVFQHPQLTAVLRYHIEDKMGGSCEFDWCLAHTGLGLHWDHNHISLIIPGDVVWLTAKRKGR